MEGYEAALPEGGWPNWVLGNHDQSRVAGRVGAERARLAQMLLLTLRGTPTVYYGDEIWMQNIDIPEHLVMDPPGKVDLKFSRDPARTLMQWDDSHAAGFTKGDPWLPVAEDFAQVNVAVQKKDSGSMLTFFRSLIHLRKNLRALNVGSYISIETGNNEVFAYQREHDGQRILVALNFSDRTQSMEPVSIKKDGELLCSTHLDRTGALETGVPELRPHEGLTVLLDAQRD